MIEAIISWICLLAFIFVNHDPLILLASGVFAVAGNLNHLVNK